MMNKIDKITNKLYLEKEKVKLAENILSMHKSLDSDVFSYNVLEKEESILLIKVYGKNILKFKNYLEENKLYNINHGKNINVKNRLLPEESINKINVVKYIGFSRIDNSMVLQIYPETFSTNTSSKISDYFYRLPKNIFEIGGIENPIFKLVYNYNYKERWINSVNDIPLLTPSYKNITVKDKLCNNDIIKLDKLALKIMQKYNYFSELNIDYLEENKDKNIRNKLLLNLSISNDYNIKKRKILTKIQMCRNILQIHNRKNCNPCVIIPSKYSYLFMNNNTIHLKSKIYGMGMTFIDTVDLNSIIVYNKDPNSTLGVYNYLNCKLDEIKFKICEPSIDVFKDYLKINII